MCGIAGAVGLGDRELVARMTGMMHYRGPDDSGLYEHGRVCLGHRRLSIIDTSTAGHQPMQSADGRLVITYNGEIYNFPALRAELEAKGHVFRGRSDTEVLLQAYAEYGVDCLRRLDGMFAFALWDERDQQLLLARDRMGIKPLFYHLADSGIAFASEMKPLCLVPGLARRVNMRALRSIIPYTCNLETESMLQSIYKLPAGEYLVWRSGQVRRQRFWHHPRTPKARTSLSQASATLREKLTDSVRDHLVGDVPVGVALSGGVDSSSLVAVMAHIGVPVQTFSAGHGDDDPDLVHARIVADHFHTSHHEVQFHPDQLAELLPRVLWHLDEPINLGSVVPMYLNYRQAQRHAKVLLIGEGADEVFAGYRHYKILDPALPLPRTLRAELYRRTYLVNDEPAGTLLARALARPLLGPVAPNPLREPFPRAALPELGTGNGLQSALAVALRHDQETLMAERLLKQADAIGMASSIEVRVPYLDRRVTEFVASLPDRFLLHRLNDKVVLRNAMAPWLPPSIAHRTKRAFQIRYDEKMLSVMADLYDRLFTPDAVQRRGWFDAGIVRLLRRNLHKRRLAPLAARLWHFRIWMLILCELWARLFIDRDPALPPPALQDLLEYN